MVLTPFSRLSRLCRTLLPLAAAFGLTALAAGLSATSTQEQEPGRREFEVGGHKYAFEPGRIEVHQDDLVKIVFRADDIAHSFTVDAYRIAKRAAAGQAVVFEFRADQPGTFPIYCNLAADDGCRKMSGELVVVPR